MSSIQAVREIRAGTDREAVCSKLGISYHRIEKIESAYCNVPDALLVRIERLFADREQLRGIISTLLAHRGIP